MENNKVDKIKFVEEFVIQLDELELEILGYINKDNDDEDYENNFQNISKIG